MKKEYYLLALTKNIFRNCWQHPFICMIIPFYPCLIYNELFVKSATKDNFVENKLPYCFSYDSSIYTSYNTLIPDIYDGHNYNKINNINDEIIKDDWIYIGNDYFLVPSD